MVWNISIAVIAVKMMSMIVMMRSVGSCISLKTSAEFWSSTGVTFMVGIWLVSFHMPFTLPYIICSAFAPSILASPMAAVAIFAAFAALAPPIRSLNSLILTASGFRFSSSTSAPGRTLRMNLFSLPDTAFLDPFPRSTLSTAASCSFSASLNSSSSSLGSMFMSSYACSSSSSLSCGLTFFPSDSDAGLVFASVLFRVPGDSSGARLALRTGGEGGHRTSSISSSSSASVNPSGVGGPCAGDCCCSADLADAGADVAPEVSLGMSMVLIRLRMSSDSF